MLFLTPHLKSYDKYLVFFSGGKDSVACVLDLLDQGIKPESIELHHHCIDGKDGEAFMDWACTELYCQAFADALGIKIYFSWKEGGFEAEMLRDESATGAIIVEDINGKPIRTGGAGGQGTRLKYPAPVADLSKRWCSAYLKVDVGGRVLTKNVRFMDGRSYLVISGE